MGRLGNIIVHSMTLYLKDSIKKIMKLYGKGNI